MMSSSLLRRGPFRGNTGDTTASKKRGGHLPSAPVNVGPEPCSLFCDYEQEFLYEKVCFSSNANTDSEATSDSLECNEVSRMDIQFAYNNMGGKSSLYLTASV
jgi:hypothetical protein